MAIGALTPPQTAPQEVLLEFPDNRLLIDLCGEYDRNLADIERKTDVQIVRRGNLLAIMGEESAQKQAAEVLQSLYARLESGRSLEQGDIDRELRMGGPESASQAGDQLEMFRGGKIELKTRKKMVEPRTDAQKAYVRNLFQNELAFGIGPHMCLGLALAKLQAQVVIDTLLTAPRLEMVGEPTFARWTEYGVTKLTLDLRA